MAVPVHPPVINVVCVRNAVSAVKSNIPYKVAFSTLLIRIKKAAPYNRYLGGCFFRFNNHRLNGLMLNGKFLNNAFMLYAPQSSFAFAQFQAAEHQ